MPRSDPPTAPSAACLLATLAFEVVFVESLERRRALTDEALAVAQRVGDDATLVQVLISRCLAIWHPSTLEERLDASAYMFDLASSLADPYLEYFAGWYRYAACVEAADIATADAVLARMTAVAREIGQPTPQWMDIFTQSGRALLAGDTTDAERLNDEQAHVGERSGNLDAGFYFGVLLFADPARRGPTREIADLVELVAADDDPTLGSSALWGVTLCTVGRDDEAAAVLARLAEGNFGGTGQEPGLVQHHVGRRPDRRPPRRHRPRAGDLRPAGAVRVAARVPGSRVLRLDRQPPRPARARHRAPRGRRGALRGAPRRSSSASMHRSCWSAPGAGAPGNFD